MLQNLNIDTADDQVDARKARKFVEVGINSGSSRLDEVDLRNSNTSLRSTKMIFHVCLVVAHVIHRREVEEVIWSMKLVVERNRVREFESVPEAPTFDPRISTTYFMLLDIWTPWKL